ncbi:MAG: ADP-ribosylglycohydrolase family protein, partial [Anaerolineae bacterium]
RTRVQFDPVNGTTIACRLFISVYDAQDHLQRLYADITTLQLNTAAELSWRIPDTNGQPIAEVGIEIVGTDQAAGTLYLDWLGWDNKPQVTLKRGAGKLWQRAWVEGIFRLRATADAPFHITQNEGVGLLIHGSREWQDYQVSAPITPHLGKSAGIAARVQGMRRYYALILRENGTAALIRELDGTTTLAEVPFAWQFDTSYHLKLSVQGDHIRGAINDHWLFDLRDESNALRSGGIALVLDEGCLSSGDVHIEALENDR